MFELLGNVYENVNHLGNPLKVNANFWQNDEIIIACRIKVYQYKMTVIKVFSMICFSKLKVLVQ